MDRDLHEQLAAVQHALWAQWMRSLFGCCIVNADGSCTIPADHVTRWWDQMTLPYSALSEREKQRAREQATTVLQALQPPPAGEGR